MRWWTIGLALLIGTGGGVGQELPPMTESAGLPDGYIPDVNQVEGLPSILPSDPCQPCLPPMIGETPIIVEEQPPTEGSASESESEVDVATLVKQQQASLEELSGTVEELGKNLRVTTASENFKLILGGTVVADFLYNTARPLAPGTPFLLFPDSAAGFSQDTFDAHARQSSVFALISGPKLGSFQTGAFVLANFYNVSLVADQYGFLPLEAFVEAKNEDWRFAAGLQFDIFNPVTPTVLPFSLLIGSGNTGNAYRGQARVVRYLYPAEDTQITLQAGVSEPVSTFFSADDLILTEDNGWPNVEARVALGLGPKGEGLLGLRPSEIGISGVIGQLRNTELLPANRVVTNVWGIGCDVRWAFSERFGFKGEAYLGQGLGTYGGSILQTTNQVTFEGIRSGGGFAELYYYLCPKTLHAHVGYGIDDPVDGDLSLIQPVRNSTYFANLIWNVNQALRLGLEITYRQTSYSPLFNDNRGVGVQTQALYKF